MIDPLNIGTDYAFYSRDEIVEMKDKELLRHEIYTENWNERAEVAYWIKENADKLAATFIRMKNRYEANGTVSREEVICVETVDSAIFADADRRVFG